MGFNVQFISLSVCFIIFELHHCSHWVLLLNDSSNQQLIMVLIGAYAYVNVRTNTVHCVFCDEKACEMT